MKRRDIKICIMRIGGTNCDQETKTAFEALGTQAQVVHINELVKKQNLLEYNALVFPGGFSCGDYVRAGAIWAKLVLVRLGEEIRAFVDENRPILGICNGFQVLIETGLLPGFEGMSRYPEAAMSPNFPAGYNCRWIGVKHENKGNCVFTSKIQKKALQLPIGHGEGRFVFSKENEKRYLEKLYDKDQLVFRYCDQDGDYAEGSFPANPNGSFHDIAGICNPEGTVFGLMPHPERAFYLWQQPDWTRRKRISEYGDGRLIFESLISHLEKRG